MKEKINLIKLSKNQLDEVRAGAAAAHCDCGCYYANGCGSSDSANQSANSADGLHSVRPPDPIFCKYLCQGVKYCPFVGD